MTGFEEFIRNLLALRTRRRYLPVERSTALMVPAVSHLDLLIDVIDSIALGRPVTYSTSEAERLLEFKSDGSETLLCRHRTRIGVEYHTPVGNPEGLSPNFDDSTIDHGVLRETLMSMEK